MPPRAIKSFEDEIKNIIAAFTDDKATECAAQINALFSHFPTPYPETFSLAVQSKKSSLVALILNDDRFPISAAQIIAILTAQAKTREPVATEIIKIILKNPKVQALANDILKEPWIKLDVMGRRGDESIGKFHCEFEILLPFVYNHSNFTPPPFIVNIPFYAALYSDDQAVVEFWFNAYNKHTKIPTTTFSKSYNTLVVSYLVNVEGHQRYTTTSLNALQYAQKHQKWQTCLSLLNNNDFIQQLQQSMEFSRDANKLYLFNQEDNKSKANTNGSTPYSTEAYIEQVKLCLLDIARAAANNTNFSLLFSTIKISFALPGVIDTTNAIIEMLKDPEFSEADFKELLFAINKDTTKSTKHSIFAAVYRHKKFELLPWMIKNTPTLLEAGEGYCFDVYYKMGEQHVPAPAFNALAYLINENNLGAALILWTKDGFSSQFLEEVEDHAAHIPWKTVFALGQYFLEQEKYDLYFSLYKILLPCEINDNASLISHANAAILSMLKISAYSEVQIKELLILLDKHCAGKSEASFLEPLCEQKNFTLATWMIENTPNLLKQNYALYWAMHHNDIPMATLLLNNYPAAEALITHMIDEETGNTLLHIAVLKNQNALIPMLLEHGASTTITNKEGKTAGELNPDLLLLHTFAPVTQKSQAVVAPPLTRSETTSSSSSMTFSLFGGWTSRSNNNHDDDNAKELQQEPAIENIVDDFFSALAKCPQDYKTGFEGIRNNTKNNKTNLECTKFITDTIALFSEQKTELKEIGVVTVLLKIIDYRLSSYLSDKYDKSFYRGHLRGFLEQHVTSRIGTILSDHKSAFIKQINASLRMISKEHYADTQKAKSLKESLDFFFDKFKFITPDDLSEHAKGLYRTLPSAHTLTRL